MRRGLGRKKRQIKCRSSRGRRGKSVNDDSSISSAVMLLRSGDGV